MPLLLILALACTRNANDTGADSGIVDHGEFAGVAAIADAERDELGAVGMAVAVFDRDGVVWTYGTGSRRVNEQLPVNGDTRFRFGSVLKMMTATAMLQQQEAGNLSLTDPLSEHLPDFSVSATPEWSSQLDLVDLTTHRGGFYDYVEIERGADDATLAQGLAWFESNGFMMAAPDQFYNYSNPNFSVAGRVLEVASGRSYREVMLDDVFAPAGMDRALFLGDAVMSEDDNWAEALGNDWRGVATQPVPIQPNSYDSGFTRPAGLGFASVTDLAAFGDLLMNGNTDVLSAESHATLTTGVSPMGPHPAHRYAHGVFVLDEVNLVGGTYVMPVLSHGGDINGYAADIYVLPEQGWGVAVLASTDGAHAGKTVSAALKLAPGLPEPTTPTPVPPFESSTLEEVAGSWNDANNVGPVTLTVDGNNLHVECSRLDEYNIPYSDTLYPVAKDTFSWEVQGYTFTVGLHRDDAGHPKWLATRSFVIERNTLRGALPEPGRAPSIRPAGLTLQETVPGFGR